ncbi:MAG: DUF1365 domain-containing protein [Proteobacteria bacterium]|nr:DUF1365 domain-containing protein [Pseudomonadota bacterium]
MNSVIYKGFVEHYRLKPVKHGFRYPVYGYGLDLDELDVMDKSLSFFGHNRLRPVAIHDKDYLTKGKGSIREKLLRVLSNHHSVENIQQIFLVTSARYLNYIFNPVSFFYCLDKNGKTVAMVVEVNNTFGERHLYIPEMKEGDHGIRYIADKEFHVSPFNDMQGTYEFFFSEPTEPLDITINLIKDNQPFFNARLHGKVKPLNGFNLLKTLIGNPLSPHKNMPRILYQAAKLYFLRKMPYVDKPEPQSPMTIVRQDNTKN